MIKPSGIKALVDGRSAGPQFKQLASEAEALRSKIVDIDADLHAAMLQSRGYSRMDKSGKRISEPKIDTAKLRDQRKLYMSRWNQILAQYKKAGQPLPPSLSSPP